ncbi:MAG: hypothetical protein WKG07_06585 [Hymenobacter sp.]
MPPAPGTTAVTFNISRSNTVKRPGPLPGWQHRPARSLEPSQRPQNGGFCLARLTVTAGLNHWHAGALQAYPQRRCRQRAMGS